MNSDHECCARTSGTFSDARRRNDRTGPDLQFVCILQWRTATDASKNKARRPSTNLLISYHHFDRPHARSDTCSELGACAFGGPLASALEIRHARQIAAPNERFGTQWKDSTCRLATDAGRARRLVA